MAVSPYSYSAYLYAIIQPYADRLALFNTAGSGRYMED